MWVAAWVAVRSAGVNDGFVTDAELGRRRGGEPLSGLWRRYGPDGVWPALLNGPRQITDDWRNFWSGGSIWLSVRGWAEPGVRACWRAERRSAAAATPAIPS